MRNLLSIFFFLVVLFSMAADEESIAVLRDRLHKRRIEVGIHGGQYVFVGSFELEVANPCTDENFILKREQCSARAEILAKRALVQARRVKVTATENALLEAQGQMSMNEDSGFYALLAKMMVRDALVLDSVEHWNPQTKKYQVAVAVSWSAKQKIVEKALAANDPKTWNRKETSCQWEEWARRIDLASVVGSRKFFDSNGSLRYVGIGCVDVDGLDITSPWMRRAQDVALVKARANLSLALYAETVSEETLIQLQRELYDSGTHSSTSFESYVGKITRHSDKRTAFAPEVYATFVTHPITKRKMFVSVCGYEPWQLAELGIFDHKTLQSPNAQTSSPRTATQPQKSAAENPGVMIWNPNTGKFEKR